MKIVVDANVLIAALISRGITSDILFTKKTEFVAPSLILKKVDKYWDEIVGKSGISEDELKLEFEEIKPQITLFDAGEYEEFLPDADKMSPDPKDVAYFALALKFDCPIWSYDPHIHSQSEVKPLDTKDVLKLVRELGSEI